MSTGLKIIDVWARLGGGELRYGRGRAFWRKGDGWNVAVDPEKGCWFDHARGVGGNILGLAQTVLDCDRKSALHWLAIEGFIEHRPTRSREERRQYMHRRETAEIVAQAIQYWRVALAEQLNELKISASETSDFAEFGWAARLCHLLENGSPDALISEFIKQRSTDAAGTGRLIEAGRQIEAEVRSIAAAAVLMIAQ